MDIVIKYLPDIGIVVGSQLINWGTDRSLVRKMLNEKFESGDHVYDLADGSKINLKRDIYSRYKGVESLFFLNYSTNNLLTDCEVHQGAVIEIVQAILTFNREFDDIISEMKTPSNDHYELGYQQYFFKDLKFTIASDAAMGGNENTLGYFYCSCAISHLLND